MKVSSRGRKRKQDSTLQRVLSDEAQKNIMEEGNHQKILSRMVGTESAWQWGQADCRGKEREKSIFRNKVMWLWKRFYLACLFIWGMQYIWSYLRTNGKEPVERERTKTVRGWFIEHGVGGEGKGMWLRTQGFHLAKGLSLSQQSNLSKNEVWQGWLCWRNSHRMTSISSVR